MAEVAVVLRCRDERRLIGRVVDAVLSQSLAADIVAVDSGSTDGTLAELRRRPVRVVSMPAASFTYGRALNVGIGATAAPLVALLSAHAVPVGPNWLAELLAPFADPAVAATYGRQLPHPGQDPFRAHEVSRYWGEGAGEDTPGRLRFSNANGAVRRAAWEEQPFDEGLPYSEDDAWSAWALGRGMRVVYAPGAAVFHSHNEGPLRHYRRARAMGLAEVVAEGRSPQSWKQSAIRVAELVRDDIRLLRSQGGWRWAPLSPMLRAAEVLGARAAMRTVRRGGWPPA